MRLDIITLFPEMVRHASSFGVTGRAVERGLVDLRLWDPREFTHDAYRTVDDRPYGGGPGMVMKAAPLKAALTAVRQASELPARVVYLSPRGKLLEQTAINAFARQTRMILVAGRYEGIDQRFIDAEVDEEWSIGDYVLSGGELAALVVFDAIARQLPGVLGHEDSAVQESHMDGLLDCPHYTRPDVFEGRTVPAVLQSGNHAEIRRWRLKQSLGATWLRRPDMLAKATLPPEQAKLLDEFKREYESGIL